MHAYVLGSGMPKSWCTYFEIHKNLKWPVRVPATQLLCLFLPAFFFFVYNSGGGWQKEMTVALGSGSQLSQAHWDFFLGGGEDLSSGHPLLPVRKQEIQANAEQQ